MKCKYLEDFCNLTYCSIKNLKCLKNKYTDLKKFEINCPYNIKMEIYYCDGIKND